MTCKEKILSNDFADLITEFRFKENFKGSIVPNCYHNVLNDLGLFYLERKSLPELSFGDNEYSIIPKCYGLMEDSHAADLSAVATTENYDPISLINSGILSVQGEPLNLTGKGVVIGFIDTGIRFDNSVFKTADKKTRILGIWDQTIQDGEPPEGFLYGTEYTKADIQRAIDSDNPYNIVPSRDTIGHGTKMASIAAGKNDTPGERFLGAAPDAEIVMVKLKEIKPYLRDYYLVPEGVPCYGENDIIAAIQYLQKYAISFSRPIVICLGMGTNLGDHSGTSPLARYINYIGQQKSKCFVIAGGNEGNNAHHFMGSFTESKKDQDVEIRVGSNEHGFILELWGEPPYIYTVSIKSPGGEVIPKIYPRNVQTQEYTFIFEKTKIYLEMLLVEQNSGNEVIRLRVENPTSGIWTITVHNVSEISGGVFNMWLPIKQFLMAETYFLRSDPYITITEPGYSNTAISVSTYNDFNNSFFIESGRGFAANGTIEPDVSAPGVDVSTVLGSSTGSSLAAAITTGGAAQFLQWAIIERNDFLVDSASVKYYMIRGATRDKGISYPSREWGYGRLNISGIFDWLAGK